MFIGVRVVIREVLMAVVAVVVAGGQGCHGGEGRERNESFDNLVCLLG